MNSPNKRDFRRATDDELRAMRNAIYPSRNADSHQTDESWEHVKANWRADEEWLTEQYWKLKAK